MRVVRTYTLKTSSDHNAVFVVYAIGKERLTVCTWNVGNARASLVRRDLLRIRRSGADILLLQEVGDRDLRELLPPGWAFRARSRVATAWRRDLKPVKRRVDKLLSRPRWVGVGAGPSRVKIKHLLGVRWKIDGELVLIGNIHLVASQWNPLRLALALAQVEAILVWARGRKAHVIVGGDWNSNAKRKTRVLRKMLAAGFRWAKTGPTHGRRIIDWQLWKPGRG